MSTEQKAGNAFLDKIKWLLVIAIVVAGVLGNQYYAEESVLYRALALLGMAVVAGFIAVTTVKGKVFAGFVKEANVERRKVVWPTKQETTQTTLMVVVFVLIVGLILWGMDSLISWVVKSVIG